MEQKIMEVMRRMQDMLSEEQLRELQSALRVTFDGCELQPRSELMVLDDSWQGDLEDFLMSKALEGKSKATIIRYRYELERLLSYINKAVVDITDADISNYMRTYKRIRNIKNSTLMDAIVKYTAGITGVILYKVGETPAEKIEALTAENAELKKTVDMLQGCILEMSELVYQ